MVRLLGDDPFIAVCLCLDARSLDALRACDRRCRAVASADAAWEPRYAARWEDHQYKDWIAKVPVAAPTSRSWRAAFVARERAVHAKVYTLLIEHAYGCYGRCHSPQCKKMKVRLTHLTLFTPMPSQNLLEHYERDCRRDLRSCDFWTSDTAYRELKVWLQRGNRTSCFRGGNGTS